MGKIYTDYSSATAAAAVKEGLIFTDYNSKRVFHPSQMTLGIQDVDLDSGRENANGTMIRYKKGTKRQLSLTFPPMTTADLSAVLHAVSTCGTIGVSTGTESFFRVTYTDPLAGTASNGYRVTKTFYTGDRSSPCYSEVLGLWEEMTVDIVER